MRSKLDSIRYGLHVIVRPFDGFWDLKREHRGSVLASALFVVLTIITVILQKQGTAFLFNENKLEDINVVVDILTVILVFALWVSANWALTTLMEGEGTLKDIFIYSGYCLLPIILINIPLVAISHVIIAEEAAFFIGLRVFSYLWAGFLLFVGTLVTHQYSIGKTIGTILLILVGMMVILFLILLFFYVISEMVNYVYTIYTELRFR